MVKEFESPEQIKREHLGWTYPVISSSYHTIMSDSFPRKFLGVRLTKNGKLIPLREVHVVEDECGKEKFVVKIHGKKYQCTADAFMTMFGKLVYKYL